jgi:hypothetical protein
VRLRMCLERGRRTGAGLGACRECSGRRNGALEEATGAGAVQMERESERMCACRRGGDVDEEEDRPK